MRIRDRLTEQQREKLGIIHPGMHDRALLNVYREIRSKLLRLGTDGNLVCLVCALADEGDSSLLTLNLAAVFAFDSTRSAIVIDCDANDNVLDELTSHSAERGLINFLEGEMKDVAELIHDSGIERLRIIPSGPMTYTRTEALESLRMSAVVKHLKGRFPDRYIFINGPCTALASEVQTLAHLSDAVLFELVSRTAVPTEISEAIELVAASKVAGIIFRER